MASPVLPEQADFRAYCNYIEVTLFYHSHVVSIDEGRNLNKISLKARYVLIQLIATNLHLKLIDSVDKIKTDNKKAYDQCLNGSAPRVICLQLLKNLRGETELKDIFQMWYRINGLNKTITDEINNIIPVTSNNIAMIDPSVLENIFDIAFHNHRLISAAVYKAKNNIMYEINKHQTEGKSWLSILPSIGSIIWNNKAVAGSVVLLFGFAGAALLKAGAGTRIYNMFNRYPVKSNPIETKTAVDLNKINQEATKQGWGSWLKGLITTTGTSPPTPDSIEAESDPDLNSEQDAGSDEGTVSGKKSLAEFNTPYPRQEDYNEPLGSDFESGGLQFGRSAQHNLENAEPRQLAGIAGGAALARVGAGRYASKVIGNRLIPNTTQSIPFKMSPVTTSEQILNQTTNALKTAKFDPKATQNAISTQSRVLAGQRQAQAAKVGKAEGYTSKVIGSRAVPNASLSASSGQILDRTTNALKTGIFDPKAAQNAMLNQSTALASHRQAQAAAATVASKSEGYGFMNWIKNFSSKPPTQVPAPKSNPLLRNRSTMPVIQPAPITSIAPVNKIPEARPVNWWDRRPTTKPGPFGPPAKSDIFGPPAVSKPRSYGPTIVASGVGPHQRNRPVHQIQY